MFVKPPGPRHTVTEQGGSLVIRIPTKRNIFILGFLTFWLCGWFVGETTAAFQLLFNFPKNPEASAFMILWLTMWTIGGAFAILVWLWQLKGSEVITLSSGALSIKRAVFDRGFSRHYDLSEVRHLRFAPPSFNPFDARSGLAFWGFGGGALAFDYGYKTFRFGAGVDEAEARIILQTLLARAPRLAQADKT